VKRGLYAVNFGGGQVDITNGNSFFPPRGVLIEDGKINAPVESSGLKATGRMCSTGCPWFGKYLHSTKAWACAVKMDNQCRGVGSHRSRWTASP